jgi:uncharacterized protein YndB with AHSA1/START domain
VEAIQLEVWINASKETVFEALTSREGLDAWWGKALNDGREVGSVVEFDHGLGDQLRMKVTDIVANERVAWECVSDFKDPEIPASEWNGQQIVFELKPGRDDPNSQWLCDRLELDRDDFTILTFRHEGWTSDSRWAAFCDYGWGNAGRAQALLRAGHLGRRGQR